MHGNSSYHPLVSVIIPNYNHAPFLKERIDSVLNQTYQNFEVILLDDCSTDNSLKRIVRIRMLATLYSMRSTAEVPFYNGKKG